MKTIKKITVLSLLTITVFISSCKQTQMLPLSFTGHSKVKFAGIGIKSVKGKINVTVKNPNPVDVKVYKSDLDVKINDIAIGKAKIKKFFVVPANSEVEQELYLKSNFSHIGFADIPKVIKSVQNKNITLSVKGDLRSGRFMHKTKVPVQLTDTINMQEKTKPVIAFVTNAGKKTVASIKKLGAKIKSRKV